MTLYQHHKGGIYELLFIATHSETGEKLVIYKNKNTESIFARPYEMFFETILKDGKKIPRFKKIDSYPNIETH